MPPGCRGFVTALFAALLSGCATVPAYNNSTSPDAACVMGFHASLKKWMTEDEAHVLIKEIDGVATDGHKPFCFAPGRHKLGVYATASYAETQDYVELDFDAGRKYRLHANHRGISFIFQFEDITTTPATVVSEFRFKAGNSPQAVAIPVVIPRR